MKPIQPKNKTAFFLLTFLIILTGCSLMNDSFSENDNSIFNINNASKEKLLFELPSWPPQNDCNYPELYGWKIKITSAHQKKDYILLQEEYIKNSTIYAETEKNMPLCITAEPVTFVFNSKKYLSDFYKPAGAIYPYEKPEENIRKLTWQSGYTAYIMQQLFYSSDNYSNAEKTQTFTASFNWKKFNDYIKSKSEQAFSENKCFNPWLYDTETVLTAASQRKFTAQIFSAKKVIHITQNNLENININDIHSSYVPENEQIKNGTLSLSYEKNNFFCKNDQYLIIYGKTNSRTKKFSVQTARLPILLDGL